MEQKKTCQRVLSAKTGLIVVYVKFGTKLVVCYRQHCVKCMQWCLVSSGGDFLGYFCRAGVTHCTDAGDIWCGGVESTKGVGPKNGKCQQVFTKFRNIKSHRRILCTIFTKLSRIVVRCVLYYIKISGDSVKAFQSCRGLNLRVL